MHLVEVKVTNFFLLITNAHKVTSLHDLIMVCFGLIVGLYSSFVEKYFSVDFLHVELIIFKLFLSSLRPRTLSPVFR